MFRRFFMVVVLLAGAPALAAGLSKPVPIQFMDPVQDPDFMALTKELSMAANSRQRGPWLDAAREDIPLGPPGESGLTALRFWMGEADKAFEKDGESWWDELAQAMELGCGAAPGKPGAVVCPFAALSWPVVADPRTHAYVSGNNTPVRRTPYDQGRVLGLLSNEVIKLCDHPHTVRRHTCVQLPGQPKGYVSNAHVWPGNGVRLTFKKVGRRWRWVAHEKGAPASVAMPEPDRRVGP